LTLEDPVEGRIPEICQSSLDVMHGLDLASAFKHLLRQDPDIMALGEIRDRNCLREALQAGLSGHKILATFHAGSIDETVIEPIHGIVGAGTKRKRKGRKKIKNH
jgi:type II secretory ATPase GspE/PulE/Tfp pilus assembly ATPase PilB-like protein